MPATFTIEWVARQQPLVPKAVAARGGIARQLLQRVLQLPDERLARLQGTTQDDVVVLTGREEELPWVPGVYYLGADPDAPHLLVPTNLEPNQPLALIDAALYKQYLRVPLAVLAEEAVILPLDVARVVNRGVVERWLEQHA